MGNDNITEVEEETPRWEKRCEVERGQTVTETDQVSTANSGDIGYKGLSVSKTHTQTKSQSVTFEGPKSGGYKRVHYQKVIDVEGQGPHPCQDLDALAHGAPVEMIKKKTTIRTNCYKSVDVPVEKK